MRHQVQLGASFSACPNGIARIGARRCGCPSLVGGLRQILLSHGLISFKSTCTQNDSLLRHDLQRLALFEDHNPSDPAVVCDERLKGCF